MDRLRPGENRYQEFEPKTNDSVSVRRSSGAIENDWIVDQVTSKPGCLTVVAVIKVAENNGKVQRLENVFTIDELAEMNGYGENKEEERPLSIGSSVFVLRTGESVPEPGWKINKFSRNKDNTGMDVLVVNEVLGKEKLVSYSALVSWNS